MLHSLLWQVLKNGMVLRVDYGATSRSGITLRVDHDSTSRNGESYAETSLLRWINSTLNAPGLEPCHVTDFKDSLKDSVIYSKLLDILFPSQFDVKSFLDLSLEKRADAIVTAGKSVLGKVCILEPNDILKGNETMNVLFLASLCRRVAEEMCQSATISRGSSIIDAVVPMHELIPESALEEHILELVKENEELKRQVCMLQEALAEHEGPDSPEDFADDEEDETVLDVINDVEVNPIAPDIKPGPISPDIKPGPISPEADSKKVTTISDSVQLREIFYGTKDLLPVLATIYKNLSAYHLSQSCSQCGYLTKKSVSGVKWSRRYAVLRDNFLFFFKDIEGDAPTSVEKVDDCLVREIYDEYTRMKDPVLSIEVASHVNAHYFYISADMNTIESWRQTIIKVSSWWVSRQ